MMKHEMMKHLARKKTQVTHLKRAIRSVKGRNRLIKVTRNITKGMRRINTLMDRHLIIKTMKKISTILDFHRKILIFQSNKNRCKRSGKNLKII